jgi:acyl carrier protein
LSEIDGIKPGLVFAAPFRGDESPTDELAVFFTPQAFDDSYLDPLIPKIHSAVAKRLGVRISHLVPITEEQIERTATGKAKRSALVEGLRLGRWALLKPASKAQGNSDSLAWLSRQWKEILKLEFDPGRDQNFFDLGGDSLASAELLLAVEEKYNCRLPLEKFFENPTPSTMAGLISASTGSANTPRHATTDNSSLLRKLQGFSASWQGKRLFSDSLLIGFNTEGTRPPIFWVLHNYAKASHFAKHLGPDQPLYAMRSCVDIIEAKDFTPEVLETVCNRCLWEMQALSVGSPFILGGTCQGGIFALAMARRLKQMGRSPLFLALLEWNFSYGKYTKPTLLIYGEESHTASVYQQPEKSKINWREEFPKRVVVSVPGRHEDLERRDDSVSHLAKILIEKADQDLAIPGLDWRGDALPAKLVISQAETKELRAKLKSRERQVRKLKASKSWRVTAPVRAVLYTLSRVLESK